MTSSNRKSHPLTSFPSAGLQGEFCLPGDKSISHRALILGALSEGMTTITGLLESEDILCTVNVLRALGVRIEKTASSWRVHGVGLGGLLEPSAPLDFGNSGTGARLMMGVVAGHAIRACFTGDASLSHRPMGRVLDPLKCMGMNVLEETRLTLPLTLLGSRDLTPIVYRLPVPSAQVKSAVLLAGLLTPGRTSVIETEPTRDHTERMLRFFGAEVAIEREADGTRISVVGQAQLRGREVFVPSDPSSSAFLAAAATICPDSRLILRDVLVNPTRTGFYATLAEMGASIAFENQRDINGEPVADIAITSSALKGVRVPASRAPSMIDEYPCLAAVAAFAEGTTVMEGLAELRVKESDRLSAMIDGLTRCGVTAEGVGDTLCVTGSRKVRGGATIATHLDHRIAMAFLVLGLAADRPVTVDDASMIATSFPDFEATMAEVGARLERPPVRLETEDCE